MKSNNVQASQEFDELFAFKSNEERIEHDARILMVKFLSEIEKLSHDKGMLKKDLANAIGTSASYITQIFRGDKLVNLITLVKFQDIFNVDFEVRVKDRNQFSESGAIPQVVNQMVEVNIDKQWINAADLLKNISDPKQLAGESNWAMAA